MVTVGYGDIAPTNTEEKIMCSILIVLLCGIYGYSLNQIGVIFNELNKNSISIQQKKIYINKFMLRKNVSENLQNRIREYLDYYWEKKFDDDTQEEGLKIIQSLNSNLKKQLIYESNNLVIRDSPIFAQNFSPQLLSKLTQIITEQKYMPEEIIYEKDSSDLNSIFFIEQGEVQIINNGKNKVNVINELTKGQNFGYYSFFTGQPREFTTRSKSFSAVLKIDLKPFLELLKEFEDDLEKYYYIRDLINYNSQYDLINQYCSECHQSSHQINNCPKIHYCCDRIQLVKNEYSLSSLQIDRDPTFKRQSQKKTGYKQQIIRLLDKYIDFAVTFDVTLNEYEDKFLQSYYDKMEMQTPVNAEAEQNQKKDFIQFISQIAEDQPTEVFSINFDNNEKKKQYLSQHTLTQIQQDEHSKKQQQTLLEKSVNFDETSIGDNLRARVNSGNVSQSSYNNLQSNKDPNSNINLALKLNQYFFQNTDESPSENNQLLRLQSLVRNFEDLQIPLLETPVSRFSKLNIKREKSLKSFQRMISESLSIKSKLKNDEKIESEKQKNLEKSIQNDYSNIDTEIINPLDESVNYSQVSRRKLLKLEYDTMKIMKVYFIRDNYPSIIQKFNLTNRYYSYQIKNKSQIKMSSNEQNSKFDNLIDQGERQFQENTFISSQKENQNEFAEPNSGMKILSGSRLFRQSTINIIQQTNNNKSKARSIFRKFIYENRRSQSNNTSFHSSQNESENNKGEDQDSVFKRKSIFKYPNQNKIQSILITQNSNQIQDIDNISVNDNNEQKSIFYQQGKDQDQQSEIQDESKINFFPNQQIQNKMILDSSSIFSARTIQNEAQQSQRTEINRQSDDTSKQESDIKILKDDKTSQRILCKFDSFSDL
ncbi:cyclic nucleotide-binding domain protein (macronuclear) [Tetrahymena thermophila SB210]|uniref:Cyclic nucleotide-binding domain protein n=1 Tax=Tetrahymena thermophila (strain SB210) TaxID=312017 RepID=W7XF86_TETTS|nr:cyclic nucleotide-binding domain protein [Tetrahymena thermophila SB210]EWS75483.1 cyclic nucleotide-binding domain protein [Tetrahymena thermophila SB210]|eukprot:XP_012651952.1 cyclic nucleotide-binding domain protein [Tetrahymena thermophila SB210]